MTERSSLHRLVACLPVLGIVSLVWLPAEHLHVGHTAGGHHSQFVHRHFDSHRHAGAATEAVAVVEHDGHSSPSTKLFAAVFTGPEAASQAHPPSQLLGNDEPDGSLSKCCSAPFPDVDTSAHDPPWVASSGLRAPPFPLV